MVKNNVFSKLDKRIVEILRKLGIERPTLIQELAIEFLLRSDENVILVAPTGAGKTEAAILPILSKMFKRRELDPIKLLYITPLRALNRDLLGRLLRIFNKIGVSVDVRHGDTPQSVRRKQAFSPPIVLITTPETLNILLWSPRLRQYLRNVRYVIIDEVHSLASSKRGIQLTLALERLKNLCGSPQIILLSATIANPDVILKYFTGGKGGRVINASQQKTYKVSVEYIPPNIEVVGSTLIIKPNISELIKKLYEDITTTRGRLIIFTNTRDMAEVLAVLLRKQYGLNIAVHHSSISKELRISTEENLRQGKIKAVVATSSLELGIDIGGVELVIQVFSPRRIETMLQRIGRAGHFVEQVSRGKIYTMTVDDFLESLAIVMLGRKWEIEPIEVLTKSYDVLAHQIIGIIRDFKFDYGRYPTIRDVYNIVTRAYPYKTLSMAEFLAVCRFLNKSSKAIKIEEKFLKLGRNAIKMYFDNVSMIPMTIKYRVVDIVSNKQIGELDEKFALELEPGTKFVLAGQSREVISVDYAVRKVYVRQVGEISQTPSWIGELMPVPYIVAKQVGILRRIFAHESSKFRELLRKILGNDSAHETYRRIREIMSNVDVIPDERHIVFEYSHSMFEKGLLVIHLCAGNKINRLFSMIFFRILLEQTNIPVLGYSSDPYRIFIELYPGIHRTELIEEAIRKALRIIESMIAQGTLEDYVRDTIKRSTGDIIWYFLNVARRFGIIGEEGYPKRYIFTVMEKYGGSILMQEAVNEFLMMRGDLDGLIKVLNDIILGRIKVVIRKGISVLVNPESWVVSSGEEEERLREHTLKQYMERLNKRRVKWVCLHCGYYEIRKISDGIISECPSCKSHLLSVTKPWDNTEYILEKVKKKLHLKRNERLRLEALYAISRFLRHRTMETLYAVASAGANLQQIVSLLSRYGDANSLLARLLELEINYAKIFK